MKVPLSIFAHHDKIIIHRNKKAESVDIPFKPFILYESNEYPHILGKKGTWTKIPDNVELTYTKQEFDSVSDFNMRRKEERENLSKVYSNNYIEQIFISDKEWVLNYPNDNDIRLMFFDIEVASKGDGLFPTPINNDILTIGYSIWDYKSDGTKVKVLQKVIDNYNEVTKDFDTCYEFAKDINELDPDIIAGYNSEDFDWPYVIERCVLNKIDTKLFSRGSKDISIYDEKLRIPGRILFDIYNSNIGAHKDQNIFGIKSRTLKDVARYYKIDIEDIEVKENISNMLQLYNEDKETLIKYQIADILRTEFVGQIYIRNCIVIAEMLMIPLDNILNMYSSFVPKLFVARNMYEKRLINVETNFQKYNTVNGSVAKLGSKFTGAVVGLKKKGFFNQVYKIDFRSMYPSAICNWNLGPDTTTFVEKKPYTGQYKFDRDDKYN